MLVAPPDALLRDCPRPPFQGKTNGDLLDYSVDVSARLDACNSDKKLIRRFVEETKKGVAQASQQPAQK